jgi:hypothetical protein
MKQTRQAVRSVKQSIFLDVYVCKCIRCYNLHVLVLSNMPTYYVAKKLTASAQASNATTEMSSHLDVDDLDASVSRSVAENNDPDSLVV